MDEYLVSGYQNPRINPQSMLLRHALIRALFGDEFDSLMREELLFCTEAVDAVRRRAEELGVTMGVYANPAKRAKVQRVCESIAHWEPTYEWLWSRELRERDAEPLCVLELGCGSANEYRFLESYGIARFLDYTGVDGNPANIANARRRFPDVRFEARDVAKLRYRDRSFDYVVASHVFEQLPLSALPQAIDKACRLARRGLVLSSSSMGTLPEHQERLKKGRYANHLSAPAIEATLRSYGQVSITHIGSLLLAEYGCKRWHRKGAWVAHLSLSG